MHACSLNISYRMEIKTLNCEALQTIVTLLSLLSWFIKYTVIMTNEQLIR